MLNEGKFAGRKHFRVAAQIHHVGIRSAKAYVTPRPARLHGDVIVVALTSGNQSDWARKCGGSRPKAADVSQNYGIEDPMVRIEPIRREWAEALAEGDAVFTERFGIPVETGWSGFPEAVPILLQAAKSGVPGEWGPQLFFDDDGALVGNGGWKGPPQEGEAELGYAVAPSRQRQGIATAVVRELVQRARRADLRVVAAHTLAERNASTKVLARCGFTRTAQLADPDQGQVWRWELPLRQP